MRKGEIHLSTGERLRTLIFAVLFTIGGIALFAAGISVESSKAPAALIMGLVFLAIGGFDWIKLAPSKSKKDRPVKQNSAHMAREAELEQQKRQQELAHEVRKQSYRSNPEPLQIRQWNPAFKWDWDLKRHALDQALYIWPYGTNDMTIFKTSGANRDLCVIQPKDGVWVLCPLVSEVTVHMNSEAARSKCPGMDVNPQQFTVRKGQEQELLPGDCFVVTYGSATAYFRIDRWSITG